mmetsp:Transcript_33383/g.30355  ORF Transcript_33383/g.30355 Transcript_33383/m.30355 type:complete len:95 (+) Transcript_33383:1074-1358(+)
MEILRQSKKFNLNWQEISNNMPWRKPLVLKNRYYYLRKKGELDGLYNEIENEDDRVSEPNQDPLEDEETKPKKKVKTSRKNSMIDGDTTLAKDN